MPGPVSDSYDPEFSTSANAQDVREAIQDIVGRRLREVLGPTLQNIVEVVHGEEGPQHTLTFTEQELRVIRFALNRALESI
jgi:hypothetical protein